MPTILRLWVIYVYRIRTLIFSRSSFSEFASKYSKDERYKSIEKVRERESLFNEFILEVRKREKDEKNHKKEQVRNVLLTLFL